MRSAAPMAFVFLALCLAGAAAADVSSDALIHADATRALGYTGRGVTVAVLDTGTTATRSRP